MKRQLSFGVALCFGAALGCGDDTGSSNNPPADGGVDTSGTSSTTSATSTTGSGTGTGTSSTGTGTGTGSTSSTVTSGTGGDSGGPGGDGGTFTISSPNFDDGAALPDAYTCEGKAFGAGYSPELNWSGAPASTKSYAIVFRDETLAALDLLAYANHWAAWDIPVSVTGIPEQLGSGEEPEDLEGGKQYRAGPPQEPEFFGPCPSWQALVCENTPRSNDEYAFILYAFDEEELDLPDPVAGENYVIALSAYFEANSIAKTELNATSDAKPAEAEGFECPLPPPTDAGTDAGDGTDDDAGSDAEAPVDTGIDASSDVDSDAGDEGADAGDAG